MSQRTPDYDALRERERQARAQEDGEQLATAIRTRRRLKCIAQGAHTDGGNCARCGL